MNLKNSEVRTEDSIRQAGLDKAMRDAIADKNLIETRATRATESQLSFIQAKEAKALRDCLLAEERLRAQLGAQLGAKPGDARELRKSREGLVSYLDPDEDMSDCIVYEEAYEPAYSATCANCEPVSDYNGTTYNRVTYQTLQEQADYQRDKSQSLLRMALSSISVM